MRVRLIAQLVSSSSMLRTTLDLDTFNEGFTVFGEVISGMEIVDSINGLQRGNFGSLHSTFTDVPIQAIQPDNTVLTDDFVILNEVTVVLPR